MQVPQLAWQGRQPEGVRYWVLGQVLLESRHPGGENRGLRQLRHWVREEQVRHWFGHGEQVGGLGWYRLGQLLTHWLP